MSDLIERYLDCWNATDAATRSALIEQHWSEHASYVDPLAEARGRVAVDALIAAVQAQFPDFVFSAAGPVDAHHRQARFTWNLGPSGAEPVIVGFDVIVLDADDCIESVFGFLDKVPS
jgi:hypothetical protein